MGLFFSWIISLHSFSTLLLFFNHNNPSIFPSPDHRSTILHLAFLREQILYTNQKNKNKKKAKQSSFPTILPSKSTLAKMQFTKALIVLSALAGFTLAAPAAEPEPIPVPAPFAEAEAEAEAGLEERTTSSGKVALTFTGTNGTVYTLNAPTGWTAIKTGQSAVVEKVTINTALSTCAFIGGRGNFFVDAALFGTNTITIFPAQSINVLACASLQGSIIHF